MSKSKRALRIVLGVLGCWLILSDDLTFTGPLMKQAQAYIGNPLTPMSYAGVARRTTRRAAYASAYAAPAYGYPPPPAYGYPPPPAYGYPAPPAYPPPPGYRPPY
jgi:hypothetical protein